MGKGSVCNTRYRELKDCVCEFSGSAFGYFPVGVNWGTGGSKDQSAIRVLESMDTQKRQPEKQSSSNTTAPAVTSCRKKKNEQAAFLEDLKDHIDEFINASVDEHKSCFKKTIHKMFGLSKAVTEGHSNASKEVESCLPLRTTVQD
ncbi:unnamed protein product [Sphenostylis stenocarpa]|uniref:Uncharacterized protein n=1 Tax=Sphenostylis stenocarpa TaxID=92480 RepID=A0AA86SHM5_9FABA|nr:unnamed protein product [Sphenostylis stenocarpa]